MSESNKILDFNYYLNKKGKKNVSENKNITQTSDRKKQLSEIKIKIYHSELETILKVLQAKKDLLLKGKKELKYTDTVKDIWGLLEGKLKIVEDLINKFEIETRSNSSDFSSYFWKYDDQKTFKISINFYHFDFLLSCIKNELTIYYENELIKNKGSKKYIHNLEGIKGRLTPIYFKMKEKVQDIHNEK